MSKADELLKRAGFFEKLALYSDRDAFLRAVAQTVDDVPPPPPPLPAPTQINLPEQTVVGQPPVKQFPAIPKETQYQLNQLLVPAGKIAPLQPDGKLGPNTTKALQIFTATYSQPATPANIKNVFDVVIERPKAMQEMQNIPSPLAGK